MGSRTLRGLFWRAVLGAGLAASSAAAQLPVPGAGTSAGGTGARVRELAAELDGADARAPLAELARIWRELDLLPERGGGAEREAFLTASVLLAQHAGGDGAGAVGETPLGLLERASAEGRRAGVSPELAAWADYALARAAVGAGRLARAEEVLQSSLAGAAFGSANEPAVLHLLAEVLRRQTRWEEAYGVLDLLELRLSERGATPDAALWRARLHGARGQLHQFLGRLDLAARSARLEVEEAERSGDPFARLAALLDRCDLALLSDDHAFVLERLAEIESWEPWGRVGEAERAQLALYRAAAAAESERTAELRGLEPPTGPSAAERLRALLDGGRLPVGERLVALRQLADATLRGPRPAEAAGILEEHRALLAGTEEAGELTAERVLASVLRARLARALGAGVEELGARRAELEGAWHALLEQWSRSPLFPDGVGFLHHSERRDALATLVELDVLLGADGSGAERALAHALEAEAMGTLARRFDLARCELATLRAELLRPDQGVLLFLSGREGSHLLGFDRQEVWHEPLPPWPVLQEEVAALRARLATHPARLADGGARARHARRLEAQAHALSARLLPRRAQRRVARWRGVTVAGTDRLAGFPASLLRLEEGWLGAERAVDELPSLAVGLALARRAGEARARERVLLVTALDPGPAALERWPDLERARWDQGDTRRLCAPFGERARALERAGGETFGAELAEASLVHFVAHGVELPDRPRPAALLLTDASGAPLVLGCEEVEGLRLGAAVLLTACGTARGPGRPGDDHLAHLGGSFLLAGAPAVVLASAAVELEPSLVLMEEAHRRLADGAALAEAVRSGRAALAAGDDPLGPFLAAQFEVLGLGQRSVFR